MSNGKLSTHFFSEHIVSAVLDNGLTILVYPRPGTQSAFVQAAVRTGSIHEQEFLGCGLSHFLEHMAFSGTETHPGHTDIADRVNALGGELNACTSCDSTKYYMDVPSFAVKEVIDMLYGMIALPLFPEERFQHEKGAILRESAMYQDRPGSRLYENFIKTAFQVHPIRVPIIGYTSKIETVDREMMRAYYERRYSPCRTAFIVAGDVDPQEIIDYIAAKAGAWRIGRVDEPVLPCEPQQTFRRTLETEFKAPMGYAAIGYRAPGRDSREFQRLDLLTQIMVGSDSARLVRELCTRKHIADDVQGLVVASSEFALNGFVLVAEPEKLAPALDTVRSVMNDFKTNPIRKNELSRVVTAAERGFVEVLRTASGIGKLMTRMFLEHSSPEELDAQPERLRKITAEDLRESAEKLCRSELETVVTQLPAGTSAKRRANRKAAEKSQPELTVLTGGQRIVSLQDHETPLVSINMYIPAGVTAEDKQNLAISNLMAAVLPCGTESLTEEQFNEKLDDLAMSIDVHGEFDYIRVSASCLQKHLPKLLPILKSMLSEPTFSPEILERERSILIHEFATQASKPNQVAMNRFREVMYTKGHPFGAGTDALIASLQNLTRQDLLNFFARMFDPARTVVSISAPMDKDHALVALQPVLDAVPWSNDPLPENTPEYAAKKGILRVDEPMDKAQSIVMLGFPAVPLCQIGLEDQLVLYASNGMASSLFKTVREERGLAYYASLYARFCRTMGYMAYVAGTKPGAEEEVLRLFEEERQLRMKNGFSQEDFLAAKEAFGFALTHELQDAGKLAAFCGLCEFNGRGMNYIFRRQKELETVTPEGMNKAAKRIFHAPFQVISVVSSKKNSKNSAK